MAEAPALDRHRGNEGNTTSEFGDALKLLHCEGRFANRNVRRRKEPLTIPLDQTEGPAVIRSTERRGELRIREFAFPNNSQGWIDDLARKPLGVEETDSCSHVLPLITVDSVAIESADRAALFFLAVAAENRQHFFNIAQPHRLAVHQHCPLVRYRVGRNSDGTLAKSRLDVLLEQLERLHEVTVSVNYAVHRRSSTVIRLYDLLVLLRSNCRQTCSQRPRSPQGQPVGIRGREPSVEGDRSRGLLPNSDLAEEFADKRI